MPTPWFKKVRDGRTLTIFPTDRVTGTWRKAFQDGVAEFNRLSAAAGLGVRLETIGATKPDPTSWLKGANVQFDVASGTVHENVYVNPKGEVVNEFTDTIDGNDLHGLTRTTKFQSEDGLVQIFRAYIYVPATPMFMVGHTGAQQKREAGDGVKLFIAVHEMVHACGMGEHSPADSADLMVPQPQPAPGATPAQDKLQVRFEPRLNLPLDPPQPPLQLSGRTAGLVKSAW